MFSVGGRTSGQAVGGNGKGGSARAVVLPRPLRRAARFVRALADGQYPVPRHAGTIALVALFGTTAALGIVLGGHTHSALEATSTTLGFGVDKVNVTGNVETSDIDVLQQLRLDGATSILTLNVHDARAALMTLPWVADAQVRKVYPDAVDVKLTERKAFAIWQHGQDLSLIERDGGVIVPFVQGSKFSDLPLYVGFGAETAASGFDGILSNWPALRARVRAIVRVADRRWNLVFDNGVTAKLPHTQVAQALEDLSVMERDRSILSREIVAIDLRLPDRVTVQLTQQAAERRDAEIKARDKALKKAEHAAWNHTKAGSQA